MTFATHIVEGIYSNAECARKAGYSEDVAKETGIGIVERSGLSACCGVHPRIERRT